MSPAEPSSYLTEPDTRELQKIIFVDDSRDDYDLLDIMIRDLLPQVEISWFPQSSRFIDFLDTQPPSEHASMLVMMDVNMPVKGAREMLEEMRAKGYVGKFPVIVVSNVEKPSDRDYYTGFDRVAFSTKPCGLADYTRFIAFIIQHFQ
jgi:CheY-like chemotaxis protein